MSVATTIARLPSVVAPAATDPSDPGRARTELKKTGIRGLDEMLGGGIPAGYSVLVAGPSGSGKTTLATQFILEGVAHGEPAAIAVFERRPRQYVKTISRGAELERLIRQDKLQLMYIRPLDLSVDDDRLWLEACLWPEEPRRLDRHGLAGADKFPGERRVDAKPAEHHTPG